MLVCRTKEGRVGGYFEELWVKNNILKYMDKNEIFSNTVNGDMGFHK